MTPKDIDAEYEAWKADMEPTFDGKPAEPMTADECVAALTRTGYTARLFQRMAELTDDTAFQRLVELARQAETAQAEAERRGWKI